MEFCFPLLSPESCSPPQTEKYYYENIRVDCLYGEYVASLHCIGTRAIIFLSTWQLAVGTAAVELRRQLPLVSLE